MTTVIKGDSNINLDFSTGGRITGDFSNATIANRAIFQSSTTNGASGVIAMPNGTGVVASWSAMNSSDANNGSIISLRASDTDMSVRSGNLGTGTFLPLTFYTNNSERMRIDTSGNVGIGTSSPASRLHTRQDQDGVTRAIVQNRNGSGTPLSEVAFITGGFDLSDNRYAYIQSGGGSSTYLAFGTGNGAAPTERARIDSSGNFLSANGAIYFTSAQYRSNVASSQLQFINNSAGVSLAVNGTSWGSLSDERDKEIIEPITDAVSKVASLRSVIGRYKVDEADKRRAFLIAQDVKAVLPEAVTELDDEQKTLILQYTEVIPLLTAAIQEQQAIILAQESALTALTARVTALEGQA